MDVQARISELAKLPAADRPVVSVYLRTAWTDEEQRERVRIFVKNGIRGAQGKAADIDLAWIEAQVERLIARLAVPEASGVALFAGGADLREILPVRITLQDAFVVDETPYLRPLAGAVDGVAPALVVFVDGTYAQLLTLASDGPGEEVVLQRDVEGRHSTGGWAALAQSRYQRHIEEHRDQHYDATAAAVADLTKRGAVRRIVLAGAERSVASLRERLPADLAGRVAGVVPAARHEPMAVIAERAAERLVHADDQAEGEAVDRLLDAAAKGGRAVAGLESTLESVNRQAVQRLYLLPARELPGVVCEACSALQRPGTGRCSFCNGVTRATELGEAMVERVLASGGTVGVLERHAGLAEHQGVGALLRYAA
jgi:Bacterial archaeo-eukaryotic release factor family 10